MPPPPEAIQPTRSERERDRDQAEREHRPYNVRVNWIDGTETEYEVRSHVETESGVTLFLNKTRIQEVIVPWSNIKQILIDRG